jgi:Zn-dependent alcohol dehydrogenase
MSRHEPRQRLARDFGATDIVTERGDEGVAVIKDMAEGIGADAVLECAITAITRGSPKHSAAACWTSTNDGRVICVKVATSGAGFASAAWASHRRWLANWPTARRAF